MSMFLSIIGDSFRLAQKNSNNKPEIFSYMFRKFLRWSHLQKPNDEEIREERDKQMRSKYLHPFDALPIKVEQLSEIVDRIYIQRKPKQKIIIN